MPYCKLYVYSSRVFFCAGDIHGSATLARKVNEISMSSSVGLPTTLKLPIVGKTRHRLNVSMESRLRNHQATVLYWRKKQTAVRVELWLAGS